MRKRKCINYTYSSYTAAIFALFRRRNGSLDLVANRVMMTTKRLRDDRSKLHFKLRSADDNGIELEVLSFFSE